MDTTCPICINEYENIKCDKTGENKINKNILSCCKSVICNNCYKNIIKFEDKNYNDDIDIKFKCPYCNDNIKNDSINFMLNSSHKELEYIINNGIKENKNNLRNRMTELVNVNINQYNENLINEETIQRLFTENRKLKHNIYELNKIINNNEEYDKKVYWKCNQCNVIIKKTSKYTHIHSKKHKLRISENVTPQIVN